MEAGRQNLPEMVNHPAHGQLNVLVLRLYDEVRFKYTRGDDVLTSYHCSICLNKFKKGDYVYACDTCPDPDCDFMVDVTCSSIKAKVDFRGHKHPLFFIERVNPIFSRNCHSCKGYTKELIFRCVKDGCGYNLHLSCGPMPVAIQYSHSGHKLTLSLKDVLLDGADPEDSWCDICEERRDPMKCVYRSEDPPFTASIDCLLPQILRALQGDHGEVKLRSVRQHIPCIVLVAAQGSTDQEQGEEKSVLDADTEEVTVERKIETDAADVDFTFDCEDIFELLPKEDQEFIQCVFTKTEKRWSAEGIESVTPYKFSDEAFKQFKEHAITGAVNLSRLMSAHWVEGKPRFVKVGSNLVYPELVPLYRRVIDEHGDFTAGSPLSPISKAVLLMLLLMLIQGTQGLQVCEITGDLLCSLQFFLEFMGGELGFDVQFARDNLENLARACYAIKFVKARDDITAEITQKIEQLERDIPEDKPKIEALKEQYRRGKESAFVKQCLAEASSLKWKNAGEFLGLDQVE